MGREHDRRHLFHPCCRRKVSDEVAAVAAELLTGLVFFDRTAKFLQALRQEVPNFTFIMGRTANLDELEEFLAYAFLIYHFNDFLPVCLL